MNEHQVERIKNLMLCEELSAGHLNQSRTCQKHRGMFIGTEHCQICLSQKCEKKSNLSNL